MDISIIVPCYNLEEHIKNLLLSFHMLNLHDISYEILFVIEKDNQDKTEEVIKEYMADMNYQILYSNGKTVGLARNVGMKAASGDYIWFVDGDDWIINPQIVRHAMTLFKKQDEPIIQLEFVSNLFNMKHYSMVWQYIFKKSFLDGIEFSAEKHFEDNHFMEAVFKKLVTNEICFITIPSYFYNYERPGSLTYNMRRGIQ